MVAWAITANAVLRLLIGFLVRTKLFSRLALTAFRQLSNRNAHARMKTWFRLFQQSLLSSLNQRNLRGPKIRNRMPSCGSMMDLRKVTFWTIRATSIFGTGDSGWMVILGIDANSNWIVTVVPARQVATARRFVSETEEEPTILLESPHKHSSSSVVVKKESAAKRSKTTSGILRFFWNLDEYCNWLIFFIAGEGSLSAPSGSKQRRMSETN